MASGDDFPKGQVERAVYVEESRDPWATAVRVLSGAILLLIVSALSAFLYLLLTGVIDPPAPRTAVEARLETIETYLQRSPKNGKVWADYILAQSALSRYADAERVWQEAQVELAELPDEMIQADLAWAQSLIFQGRPDDAVAQADHVIASDPAAVEALGRKNPTMADAGLVETGMLGPAWVVKANGYAALGEWDDAVEAYSAAIDYDPRAADLLTLRAVAYYELGDYELARADAQEALRFLPDDRRAQAILEQLGDE
ncbi:MAG: tetratricopeptide repeat protein [Coriobacteriia bacterium]|nr:tetratricopeptide repeat protein [Coriobacteriia bacterium]